MSGWGRSTERGGGSAFTPCPERERASERERGRDLTCSWLRASKRERESEGGRLGERERERPREAERERGSSVSTIPSNVDSQRPSTHGVLQAPSFWGSLATDVLDSHTHAETHQNGDGLAAC